MPLLAQWELPELSAVSSLSLSLGFFIPVLYVSSDKHSSQSGLDRLTGSLPGFFPGLVGVISSAEGTHVSSVFFCKLQLRAWPCRVGVRLALAC